MFYFSFSRANLWHGNCLLTGFNFSIKFFHAKITFLFSVLLCYMLNKSSFWWYFLVLFCFSFVGCSTGVLLFRYSAVFRLFRQRSGVPSVFWCSAIPLLVHVPVFRCSWFCSMPYFRVLINIYAVFEIKS